MRLPALRPSMFLAALVVVMPFASGCEDKASAGAGAKTDDHGDHGAHGGLGPASQPGVGSSSAQPPATEVPKGAAVQWVMPKEGSKVPTRLIASFAAIGMTVVPAGQDMMDKSRGHHHVIIDGEPVPAGTVVPKDDKHIHFGDGSQTAVLNLTPGKHTLTLQFADGAHISYGPALSSTITVEAVEVKDEARVFFVEPQDGAKVKGPVKMKFGLQGYTVRPAMQDLIDQLSGHHHIIVDGKPLAAGTVVPKDEKNIHYGDGAVEAELALPPGKHSLTLQLADGAHLSYGDLLSHTIHVEVE